MLFDLAENHSYLPQITSPHLSPNYLPATAHKLIKYVARNLVQLPEYLLIPLSSLPLFVGQMARPAGNQNLLRTCINNLPGC